MVILSNGFFDHDDEGSLKVAQSLAKHIKKRDPHTCIVALNGGGACADVHIQTNRLFLSPALWRLLRQKREPVLYIPSTAGTRASILRALVLTWMAGRPVNALFVMEHPTDALFRFLLKASGARVMTLSSDTHRYYSGFLKNTLYLQTGVDTARFVPVTAEAKMALREKYGFLPDDRIVLHVGHMNRGRNLQCFCGLDHRYKILLVTSTVTREQQDGQLLRQLRACENITIVDSYLEKIEELYQLADVYVFPVLHRGHCIDTPLSALEAISCGLPLVTSDYGELSSLKDAEGIRFLSSFDRASLEQAIDEALAFSGSPRKNAEPYDWNHAADIVLGL